MFFIFLELDTYLWKEEGGRSYAEFERDYSPERLAGFLKDINHLISHLWLVSIAVLQLTQLASICFS